MQSPIWSGTGLPGTNRDRGVDPAAVGRSARVSAEGVSLVVGMIKVQRSPMTNGRMEVLPFFEEKSGGLHILMF
jgi:hypothetical protein